MPSRKVEWNEQIVLELQDWMEQKEEIAKERRQFEEDRLAWLHEKEAWERERIDRDMRCV